MKFYCLFKKKAHNTSLDKFPLLVFGRIDLRTKPHKKFNDCGVRNYGKDIRGHLKTHH